MVRKEFPHLWAQNFVMKNYKVFEAAQSEDLLIITCVVLTQYRSVTDGRRDGRTHRRWLRRA